jgi:hypothetical protein
MRRKATCPADHRRRADHLLHRALHVEQHKGKAGQHTAVAALRRLLQRQDQSDDEQTL